MKINNFRGELTDISAKKEALLMDLVIIIGQAIGESVYFVAKESM